LDPKLSTSILTLRGSFLGHGFAPIQRISEEKNLARQWI